MNGATPCGPSASISRRAVAKASPCKISGSSEKRQRNLARRIGGQIWVGGATAGGKSTTALIGGQAPPSPRAFRGSPIACVEGARKKNQHAQQKSENE